MDTNLTITGLAFDNFRNYQRLELREIARLVIIVGDNALGKTNIVEGIQLVSMIDSFRKPAWNDVVCRGCVQSRVSITYHLNGCDNSIQLDIHENKRRYQLNEKPKNTRDLLGLLPAVLFTPSDLQIVQGPAEKRRTCIDDLGCQLSRSFVDIKRDYTRVVKQKNSLLREEYVNPDILASWDRNLVKLGSSLMSHRIALFERVSKKVQDIYHQIAPSESLSTSYIPSWCSLESEAENGGSPLEKETGLDKESLFEMFESMVEKHGPKEIRQSRSLIGPHRDEISFFIDGKDARRFGSQGQQRSIALALKIAEVEVLREVVHASPILLLDDVMSELDEKRRVMLLELIDTTTQTFITTTNLGYFDERTLKRAQIIRLPLNGGSHAGQANSPPPSPQAGHHGI